MLDPENSSLGGGGGGSAGGEADGDGEYTPYGERVETYLVPALFALIFVVGVLGNGTLVLVYARHRAMRNAPNTYIFSLALADLLVLLTCVPFASLIYTLESWPWGALLCRASEAAKDVSVGVSVFTLTALAAERYCAIVNPFRNLQLRRVPALCAALIWVAAAACAAPAALFSDSVRVRISRNLTILVCSPYPPHWDAYPKWNAVCKAVVYYWAPLLVIGALYGLMARRLLRSARRLPSLPRTLSATHTRTHSATHTGSSVGGSAHAAAPALAQARARRSVALMVLVFIIVFFVCFLPYHAFEVWYHVSPTARADYNDYTHALRILGFCLSFLNSCVNPVALYCVSGVFRQHFHRYLCCRGHTSGRGHMSGRDRSAASGRHLSHALPARSSVSRLSRSALADTSFRNAHSTVSINVNSLAPLAPPAALAALTAPDTVASSDQDAGGAGGGADGGEGAGGGGADARAARSPRPRPRPRPAPLHRHSSQ